MNLIPVKVECHSGYKADEYPVCFYWLEIKYDIKEISDRWFQAALTEQGPVANYFKVRTSGKQEFILKHELEKNHWFIVKTNEVLPSYFLN